MGKVKGRKLSVEVRRMDCPLRSVGTQTHWGLCRVENGITRIGVKNVTKGGRPRKNHGMSRDPAKAPCQATAGKGGS